MKVLLHDGPGLISRVIKWQTRGRYNHASLWRGGHVIEAREGKGVVRTPIEAVRAAMRREPRLRVDVYELRAAPAELESRAWRYAESQVGKPYAYGDVLGFITRARRTPDDAWFCSELVYAAIRHGGLELLSRTAAWEVSPDLLARSPWLVAGGRL